MAKKGERPDVIVRAIHHPVINLGTTKRPNWVKQIGGLEIACDPPEEESAPLLAKVFDPQRQFVPPHVLRQMLFD